MEVLIVIGGLLLAIALGVPIAYALALAALAGALWIDLPITAVMLVISSGVSKFAMLTIPFFVLAGTIQARGRHGAPAGCLRQCDRRAVAAARRAVARQHHGDDLHERHLRLVGGGRLGDRLGGDSAGGGNRAFPR